MKDNTQFDPMATIVCRIGSIHYKRHDLYTIFTAHNLKVAHHCLPIMLTIHLVYLRYELQNFVRASEDYFSLETIIEALAIVLTTYYTPIIVRVLCIDNRDKGHTTFDIGNFKCM
jgi:hypothetical protein